jgi:hypothetical protein
VPGRQQAGSTQEVRQAVTPPAWSAPGGGPMSTKRRLGTALGVIGIAALLVSLTVKFNEDLSYPDGLKVLGVALLIMAVAIPPWLAWLFHKAENIQDTGAARPSWSPRRRHLLDRAGTREIPQEGAVDIKGEGEGIHPGPGRRRPRPPAGQTTKATCLFRIRALGAGCLSENGNPAEADESPSPVGH